MKNRTLTALFSILTCLLFLSSPTAQASSGVRGGGTIIEVGGKKRLLDTLDQYTFRSIRGDEMVDSHPAVLALLGRIAELDWYFAKELELEMRFLTYRMTGELRNRLHEAWDSPVRPPRFRDIRPVAYRDCDHVFMDEKEFNSLDPGSQAHVLLHETMHSYFPMEVQDRTLKLMSAVNTLLRVADGELRDFQDYRFQMQEYDLDFPMVADRLLPYRAQVEFSFLLSPKEKMSKILAQANPESLVGDPSAYEPLLFTPHLSNGDAWSNFVSAVKNLLVDGSDSEFENLFLQKKFARTDLITLAMPSFRSLSEAKKSILMKDAKTGLTDRLLRKFDGDYVRYAHYRIQAAPLLQTYSGDRVLKTDRPLTELTPRRELAAGGAMDARWLGLVEWLAFLANENLWAEVESHFALNEVFLRAIRLDRAKHELSVIQPRFPREKPLAEKMLADLASGNLERFLNEVSGRTNKEAAERIRLLLSQSVTK